MNNSPGFDLLSPGPRQCRLEWHLPAPARGVDWLGRLGEIVRLS